MGAFLACVAGFVAWLRSSGRQLPERVDPTDLALMTLADTATWVALLGMITKDRVTSAVRAPFTRYEEGADNEAARGRGLRRAVGELIVCPYCIGLWIATVFAMGFVVAPRPTRWAASVLSAVLGADLLQIAYKKAEERIAT